MSVKLSPSKNAEVIAQQYLKHEFYKILGIKNKNARNLVDKSLSLFIKNNGQSSFWNLVAAISEGWKLKAVFYILSSTKYNWRLEKISIEKIVLTGMSPTIDKYVIKKYKRNPVLVAEAWRKNTKMNKDIWESGIRAYPERDHFPIFLFETPEGFRVFDGMRRTLLALKKGKRYINAWVGYVKNPNGKSLISADRCYFLANIYERSSKKDKNLEKAIIRTGKEIKNNYRNGEEVLIGRIANWSHNKDIKRIFSKMR